MSSERPVCTKCGDKHWRFVACEKATEVAEREDANAAKKEATVVYPQWRRPDGKLAPVTPSWSTKPFRAA